LQVQAAQRARPRVGRDARLRDPVHQSLRRECLRVEDAREGPSLVGGRLALDLKDARQ
jgi:hypothetical protein